MSTFPDGLFQYGGAPVGNGVAPWAGLWQTQVLFVDPNVTVSGNGYAPNRAVKTLNEAIALATAGATIFLRGITQTEDWVSLHDHAGTANAVLSSDTHNGVSIIGAHGGRGQSSAVILAGVAALTTPTIQVKAVNCNIENIQFGQAVSVQCTVGAGGATGVLCVGPDSGKGLTINNCTWDGFAGWNWSESGTGLGTTTGHGAGGGAEGSLHINSIGVVWVENCVFVNDRVAIMIQSTNTVADNITIRNNQFKGLAANISGCIITADVDILAIEKNIFGFTCPSLASPTKYIGVAGTANGHVVENTFCSADDQITDSNTLSNLKYGQNYSADEGTIGA